MLHVNTQVPEDDRPLSQIFRLSVPLGTHAPDEARKVEVSSATQPRPDVSKNEYTVEQRVAALEKCLADAMGSIPHILSELRDIKSLVGGKSGVRIENWSLKVGAAGSSEAGVCLKKEKVTSGNAGTGSPLKSKVHSPTRTRNVSGASLSQPLVVEDDASSDSPQTASPSPVRNRRATRVHANPRQRVIPFEGRLPPPRTHTPKRHATIVAPAGGGQTHDPNNKNPPVHERVTDSGTTSEPKTKLPILQPKKNSVSVVNHCPYHMLYSPLWLPTYRDCCVCRPRSGTARDVGFCTPTLQTRSWARPERASTTSPAAITRTWSPC